MPARGEASDFEELFNHLPHPVFIFDKTSLRYLAVNEAAIRRYGWSREEFLEMTILDIRPEEDREAFFEQIKDFPPERRMNGDWRHRTKDGTEFAVDIDARNIRFQGRDCRLVLAQDAFERKMAWRALQETQDIYSGLVENLSEGIAILDEEGRFLFVNSACGQIFGVAADTLLGRTTLDLVAPESRDHHARQLQQRGKGEAGAYELEVVRADGARRWLAVRTTPRTDSSGRFAGSVASFFDITQHRLALEALQQSEARFRRLVEMLPQGVVTYQDGKIIYSNPAASAITRTDPDKALGKPILEYIHPSHWPAIKERFARMLQGEEVPAMDYTFCRGDGTEVQVEAHAQILEGGERPVMISVFTDLTRRMEMEQAVRESEERYRSVIEQAQDMIFLVDLDTLSIVQANQAFHRTLGYDPSALPGLSLYSLVDADTESVRRNLAQVAQLGNASIGRRVYRHADGTTREVEVTGSLLRSGGRRLMVTLARDISERIATERALQQSQKLESLGILAGGIAHDFNNLLTAMMGNLSLAQLKSHASSPSWPYLDALEKTLQKAADLTRQMLAYSGKGRFITQVVDLNQVVEEMTHLLSVSIPKTISLRFDLGKNLPPLEADPAQLQQVVMNLVTNASDAIGDKDGVIRVTTSLVTLDSGRIAQDFPAQAVEAGPHLVLEVADSGCGMDGETLQRIFEPFFTTKVKGRGLGLSAMLGILRGHRAGIRITSVPGQGTAFHIYLPAKAGAVAEEPAPPPSLTLQPAGAVLVVDDEPDIRESAVELFRLLGFETVFEASDGAEALEVFQARATEISLVFMDLTMPRMSGREAFRALRELDPAVLVILTSGFNEEAGLDGDERPSAFLQKPYRFIQLRNAVTKVLQKNGD
ncbi:MAG TPA: PAS domain S-box protein [Holophagaceae bacterium]|jgi:two-component system cell cycle sensor histidine kinase/response regulator CckA|nr:PAS domain S-box protein [Holophagaceae bacterium]